MFNFNTFPYVTENRFAGVVDRNNSMASDLN